MPVLLLLLLATAEAAVLPLSLQNVAPVARRAWPVTAGVPLARAALADELQTRLLSPQGREVPLQTRVLAPWEDKSIKWRGLDFQADVAPAATAKYTLQY